MTERNVKVRRIKWLALAQLLVGFLVPVAIAVYTFVQNHNDQSIASANREKDLQIARDQRAQDLQVADDQQKATILASYEDFLVAHLNAYGMTLNGSDSARYVARLKTLTTVGQLDPTRKTFLLRALFEANLIVHEPIIGLERADLSFIAFEDRRWRYLSLPESNLTGAKFSNTDLSCANFQSAILHSADLSGILVGTSKGQCFPKSPREERTNFFMADLSQARLTGAQLLPTNFKQANFVRAELRFFYCLDCLFNAANFSQSDLRRAVIDRDSTLDFADFTDAKLDAATFQMVSFHQTTFHRTSGVEMKFESSSFDGSSFVQSHFSNLIFNRTDFAGSTFVNSTFSHLTMFQNNLNDVTFIRSILINVKFNETRVFKSQFIDCHFEQTFIPDEKR